MSRKASQNAKVDSLQQHTTRSGSSPVSLAYWQHQVLLFQSSATQFWWAGIHCILTFLNISYKAWLAKVYWQNHRKGNESHPEHDFGHVTLNALEREIKYTQGGYANRSRCDGAWLSEAFIFLAIFRVKLTTTLRTGAKVSVNVWYEAQMIYDSSW